MKIDWEFRGLEAVIARFTSTPANVREELRIEFLAIGYDLQAYIQTSKLSGQVLNVKSGALRSHIFTAPLEEGPAYIMIKVQVSIQQVPYAGIHELGGNINHPGGTAYFISPGAGATFVSNKSAAGHSMPRTAAHAIPMPERSYMRSGFMDKRAEVIGRVKDAANRGLKR